MLNEFKATLQRYIKQECKIKQVTDHLDRLLKKHPQLAESVEHEVDQLFTENTLSIDDKMAIFNVTSRYKSEGQDSADRTIVSGNNPDNEKTAIKSPDDGSQVDTDIPSATTQATGFDESSEADTEITEGDASDKASTTDSDESPAATKSNEVIDVGAILRNRFELKTKLGEGGMGAVFMATDKIKEEAQDKNSKVAVKVLNETFKKFRESFIALQRESSKQQRLAHPNIATVFDFDRDYTYDTVFMTMEFLEGEPLDEFIDNVPAKGLSYEEARPLIEGMCHGLAFAHLHQLVHSDFKPANIFLNKQGVVKLLDFGIARAAKKDTFIDGDGDTGKETTLFDPTSLGALTPAYASAEMLEGETPEPPDDIYALACVCYQLLGGKHPFNKIPADQARDDDLTVAPIAKLNRRQMKGLMRGLEFDRFDRTQTVEEFLDEITPKKPILAYALAGAAVILTIIGVLAGDIIQNHLREQRNQEMIAAIVDASASRENPVVAQSLEILATFDEDSQTRIQAEPNVQNAITAYFSYRIDQQVDKEQNRYDYPRAYTILNEARKYYPDSGKLNAKQGELDQRKQDELQIQRDLYTRFLKTGPWLKTGDNNIPNVIDTIRKVDPDNALLSDPRLIGSYITEARGSEQDGSFQRTRQILAQAKAYTDDQTDIINAEDTLAYTEYQAGKATRLEEILPAITNAMPEKNLGNALTVKEELAFIRLAYPDNDVLASVAESITRQLTATPTRKDALIEAENTFQSLAPVLSSKQQTTIRTRLNESWEKLGDADTAIMENRQESVTALRTEFDAISEQQANEFSYTLTQTLQEIVWQIESLVGAKHTTTQQARSDLALQYLDLANNAANSRRLSKASILVSYAKQFDTEAPGLAEAESLIADQLRAQENQRLEKERLATIIALKQDTLTKASAEQVDDAVRFLDLLKAYLMPDDPFLTTEAPNAIGKAYSDIALRDKRQFDKEKSYITKRDGYMAALETVDAGFKVAPDSRDLRAARAQIQYSLISANVRNKFNTSQVLDTADLQQRLRELQRFNPTIYERLQTEFSEVIANRISTMETYDPVAAQKFLDSARQLPLNQTLLSRIRVAVVAPSKYAASLEQAIRESQLSEASTIFSKAKIEESDHPTIKRLRTVLANRIGEANKAYKSYQLALRKNEIEDAKSLIARAIRIWRDNPDYIAAFKSIKTSIIASKAICQARLAGYGKRSRGRCYDMVSAKQQGPIMVVLPAGAGRGAPFAISKFEVSVGDFNHYCKKTNQCQVSDASPKLPVTSISLKQANDYAAWLSKTTGAKYRLPTVTEWEYAANAGGNQPRGKTYNCTLRLGDRIIKGTGLEDINSGTQNGWGIVNYIGNAQEWVTAPGGAKARGGAYRDAMQECAIGLERDHDGSPDELTSFRLVRDITI